MGQTLSSTDDTYDKNNTTTSNIDEEDDEDYDEIDKLQRELFHTIDEESKQQVEDYKQACDNGKGPMAACFATGEYIGLFERKHKEAFELFRNTCFRPSTDNSPNGKLLDDGSKAYGPGCFNMAKMLMTGKGRRKEKVPIDYEESYKMFDRACQAGHGGACHIQAKLLLTPPPLIEEQFKHQMEQYNSKKLHQSSSFDASNGETTKETPTKIPYNPFHAMDIYQQLCKGTSNTNSDSVACFTLASMLLRGDKIHTSATYGSPQELKGEVPVIQRTNEEDRSSESNTNDDKKHKQVDDTTATTNSSISSIPRDPKRARDLLEYACDNGKHSASCFNLAVMYEHGDDGVPADTAKAEEYKEKTQEFIQMFGGGGGAGDDSSNAPPQNATSFAGM